MFACLLTLILFFQVIFAATATKNLLTPAELTEMGVLLEESHA